VVKGTSTGANNFDLNDWKTGVGGEWQHWSINNGVFSAVPASASNCSSSNLTTHHAHQIMLFPNPASDKVYLQSEDTPISMIQVYNSTGQELMTIAANDATHIEILVEDLSTGIYFIRITSTHGAFWQKFQKQAD
jgi:hypothetical protein